MTAPLPNLTTFDRAALAVAAAAAGALLLELTWPHELEAPAAAGEATTAIELTAHDAVPVGPLSDYVLVGDRPLFTHDRRPFVFVAEAAPVARAGPRVEFELTAVIITSATQIALLRSSQTPAVRRVTLNQTIDGWTLPAVAPDSVVLNRGTETVTVPLRPDLGAARSGQAARSDARRTRN
ncbi:MAG TPA: hypothetical protein VKA43_07150 [Gammaproteobacteria bacterium]|nr:hypothetical protein [Gammaproteobacteria bacterium]